MVACLLILEYVSFELSYDHFNKNAANIYRIIDDRYQNGKRIQHGTLTYAGISRAMKTEFPEVVDYTRMLSRDDGRGTFVFSNGKKLAEQHILNVENSFLSMFSYRFAAGNPKNALREPFSTVVTVSLAKKLFGVNDNNISSVIGKTITIADQTEPYKITGVCRDVQANSHLQFDCLVSYSTMVKRGWKEADDGLTFSYFRHYIMLRPGTDYKALEAKLDVFSQRHFQINKKYTGTDEKFYLQPLLKIHLYSDLDFDIAVTTNPTVVWGLLIIAALILVIAWVNYVNFATAKSMERAKEVGVRKVAGATKSQLVRQFMNESLIINFVSLFIALVLLVVLQPAFNGIVNQQLSPADLFQKSIGGYSFTALLAVFMLSGVFFSGFYPAFMLSSFKPVLVLKGRFISSMRGIILRKALVIGQFTITVALIISSVVVYKQLRFAAEQKLGFNMSQMLVVRGPELTKGDSTFMPKQNAFLNEVKQVPGVLGAASSSMVPGDELVRNFDIRRSDQPADKHSTMLVNDVGAGFISLYQMKTIAGRTFVTSDVRPSWVNGPRTVMLNESAVKTLGFESPEKAVGRQIVWWGLNYTVIGVMADFHQQSLHYPIEPTIFSPGTSSFMSFSLKVAPRGLPAAINAVKQKYDAMFPGNLFNYYFLDDKFNRQYTSDHLFGRAFTIFSGLAVFIACLGLLGLSLFSTLQRSKEIGIRKVLGASVGDIVLTLTKDFIRLVILAILIASPIAWYLMHNWLQNFVIRINISWWVFAGAGLLALGIAFITISFQSITAARANPIKSLRAE